MADVELRLSADTGAAGKEIAGFRKQYADLVKTVQAPLRQIDALRSTQDAAKKTAAEFFAAKQRVAELKTAISAAGQPVKSFERELNAAERTLARATLQFDRQRDSLRQQREQLRAAGVDTRNLAAEQQRLQAAMVKAVGSGRNDQALQSAADSLGVSKARDLQAELVRLNSQYQTLRSSGTLTSRELSLAQRTYTQRVRETQQAMRELHGEQSRLQGIGAGAAGFVGQAAGAYGLLRSIQGVVRISDSWTELSDRIKLAAGSQEQYEVGMARLREISDRTFTSMSGNAESFINALGPLRDRGFSNPEVLKFVESVGLGMVASAAKGERAVSVINQFSNALQDGKLQGDAFQAMVRNTPALANALSQALGKTREELAAMATAGELTTDVWVPALISQTDELGKAVDDMNIVVGDALTRLNNAWENAISQADPKPLVEAIQELTKTISDPLIVENLVKIASALVTLTGAAISAGSGFATMGDNIGYAAAQASGNVDKLTKLEKTLKEVNNAITGDSFIGSNTAAQLLKFFAPEMLEEWKKELEQSIADVNAEISGMTGEAYKAQQAAAAKERAVEEASKKEQQRIKEERLASQRAWVTDTSKLRDENVKNAAQTARKLASIERESAKEIEAAKKAQIDTEKRYSEALGKLRGAGQGGSFTDANLLKSQARQALSSGDLEGAKRIAQSALDMLSRLQDAGENTYGFEGIINELYGIEKAADQIKLDNAQNSFEAAKKSAVELKELLDKLKQVTVTVKMDEAAKAALENDLRRLSELAVIAGDGKQLGSLPGNVSNAQARTVGDTPTIKAEAEITGIRQESSGGEASLPAVDVEARIKNIWEDGENSFSQFPPVDVTTQVDQSAVASTQAEIQELSAQLAQQLTIPVRPVVQGGGSAASPSAPGEFATGGWTGPGSKYQPAGIVHADEHVQPKRVVNEPGALPFLERIRRNGFQNTMGMLQQRIASGMRGYAEGGLVGARMVPAIPQMDPAIAGGNAYLGDTTLMFPSGDSLTVSVPESQADNFRKMRLKFGRTKV